MLGKLIYVTQIKKCLVLITMFNNDDAYTATRCCSDGRTRQTTYEKFVKKKEKKERGMASQWLMFTAHIL